MYYMTESEEAAELAEEFHNGEIFRDQRRKYSVGEKVVIRSGTQLADSFEPVKKSLRPLYEQGLIGTVVSIRAVYDSHQYLVDFGKHKAWVYSDEMKLAASYEDLLTETKRLRALLVYLLQSKGEE